MAPQHPAHLHIRWEERPGQKMEVPSAEAETEVGDVHMEEVGGLNFGADVMLTVERGHRDGGLGIQHRDVVAHPSIHVPLEGKRKWSRMCLGVSQDTAANTVGTALPGASPRRSRLLCAVAKDVHPARVPGQDTHGDESPPHGVLFTS